MALNTLVSVLIEPKKGFELALQSKHGFWLPMLAIFVSILIAQVLFFQAADPNVLIDFQLKTMPDLTPTQAEEFRQYMMQSFSTQQIVGMIIVPIILLILNALFALYLNLISKLDEHCVHGFGDWFKFTWWVATPALFASVGAILLIGLAEPQQLTPEIFNFSSVNQLMLGFEPHEPLYSVSENFNVFVIWSVVITAIGLQRWTQFSTKQAALFAVAPNFVIYGGWTLIAAL